MTKIDIKEHIKAKTMEDGLKTLGCIWEEQTPPSMTESNAYKTLLAYFQKAQYSIKNGSKKTELSIKHKKYSTLKFAEDQNNWFSKSGVVFQGDNLEARVVIDIPLFNKEFRIIATRKNHSNKYICNSLSYNGDIVYTKP